MTFFLSQDAQICEPAHGSVGLGAHKYAGQATFSSLQLGMSKKSVPVGIRE